VSLVIAASPIIVGSYEVSEPKDPPASAPTSQPSSCPVSNFGSTSMEDLGSVLLDLEVMTSGTRFMSSLE
jgi:hypothetical protein